MGLVMRFDDGLWCPVIECDACDQRIVEHGAYLWCVGDDGASDGRIVFVHKSACHEVWDRRDGRRWYWIDIDEFPQTLAWNLGFEHEAAALDAWRQQREKARQGGKIPKHWRVPKSVHPDDRAIVLRRDSVCRQCGADSALEVDHIIPRARGGTNDIENLQALCHGCNSQKRARL